MVSKAKVMKIVSAISYNALIIRKEEIIYSKSAYWQFLCTFAQIVTSFIQIIMH